MGEEDRWHGGCESWEKNGNSRSGGGPGGGDKARLRRKKKTSSTGELGEPVAHLQGKLGTAKGDGPSKTVPDFISGKKGTYRDLRPKCGKNDIKGNRTKRIVRGISPWNDQKLFQLLFGQQGHSEQKGGRQEKRLDPVAAFRYREEDVAGYIDGTGGGNQILWIPAAPRNLMKCYPN